MGKNNSRITDVTTLIQAGINPKTGLPMKMEVNDPECKTNIRKQLRILDEQQAVNRYQWFNLPNGLDGQLLERILYYNGQAMFFYMPTDETFYFLPYALDGTIDVYGRFNSVTPLPFNGTARDKKDAWITGLTRNVIKELPQFTSVQEAIDAMDNGCVLLWDYTPQISQTNIARQILQDPLLDMMAEALPFARTNLIANSGVKLMRVADEDQQAQVALASQAATQASINGQPFIPVIGMQDFQDFTNGGTMHTEDFLMYMQALDNFRLKQYGLSAGGMFEKKAHTLESEQAMNMSNDRLQYNDGLINRQKFCDLVNAIWGLGIMCLPSEAALGDMDMNGFAVDEQDQSGQAEGQQPVQTGETDE